MLTVLNHSMVKHWLSELRDVSTPAPCFRSLVGRLSQCLFLAATEELPLVEQPVETPLCMTDGHRVASPLVLAPILRAGLGMAEAILHWTPDAQVRHLGLFRDELTLDAVTYYRPRAALAPDATVLVLDPMLATGGSASAAIHLVKEWNVERVLLLCILGAPPGVERIRREHAEVKIFLCALDERLNEKGYIVPGLGDAGDRQFG